MTDRRRFAVLAVALLGMAAVCGGVPTVMYLAEHGHLPLIVGQNPRNIPAGTTTDATWAKLGPPHHRNERTDGTECWEYWGDPYGVLIYLLYFDAKGRLTKVMTRG